MAANPAAVAAAGPSSSGAALPPPQNFFPGARLANLFVRDPPELAGEQQLVQELRQRLGCHADEGRLLYQVRSSRGKMHWAVNSYFRDVLTSCDPGCEDFAKCRRALGPAPVTARATSGSALCGASQPAAVPGGLAGADGAGAQASAASGSRTDANDITNAAVELATSCKPSAGDGPACSSACSSKGCLGQCSSDRGSDTVASGSCDAVVPPVAARLGAVVAEPVTVGATGPSLDSLPLPLLEEILTHADHRTLCSVAMASKTLSQAASSDPLWAALFSRRWGCVTFPTEPGFPSASCSAAAAAAGQASGAGAHAVGRAPVAAAAGRAAGGGQGAGTAAAAAAAAAGGRAGPHGGAQQQQQHGATGGAQLVHGAGASGSGLQAEGADAAAAASRHSSPDAAAAPSGSSPGHNRGSPSPSGGVPAAAAAVGQEAHASDEAQGPSAPPAHDVLLAADAGNSATNSVAGCRGAIARERYRTQLSFADDMRCPRCGTGRLVPIVYGFPSPKLLEGMQSRRLILGGDHLIENCHVWGCAGCNSCFRFFPYEACQLWLDDLAKPKPLPHPHQQAAGVPPYTYEL